MSSLGLDLDTAAIDEMMNEVLHRGGLGYRGFRVKGLGFRV